MDISKIFKSKTRKELFRLYFTNPDREHYLRELERILDIPVSMVRKELTHLEEQGVF
jgi:predicted transcriptional regulator